MRCFSTSPSRQPFSPTVSHTPLVLTLTSNHLSHRDPLRSLAHSHLPLFDLQANLLRHGFLRFCPGQRGPRPNLQHRPRGLHRGAQGQVLARAAGRSRRLRGDAPLGKGTTQGRQRSQARLRQGSPRRPGRRRGRQGCRDQGARLYRPRAGQAPRPEAGRGVVR